MKRHVVKRARPLLGTFVHIEAHGDDAAALHAACDAAFEAIDRVDRRMSFHRMDSDLSRLNRSPVGQWVAVDRHTARVLALSNDLFRASGGVFDVRCGQTLVDWGYLPPVAVAPTRRKVGNRAPVEIDGYRARKTGPWTLDLGGIAKGYAVDRAVDALRAAGVRAGMVNAGGDLRTFGRRRWNVSIRHPSRPGQAHRLLRLGDAALATSAATFSRKRLGRRWMSPLVHPRTQAAFRERHSVSVVASTCAVADALTKVAALDPVVARGVLDRQQGRGFVLDVDGRVRFLN